MTEGAIVEKRVRLSEARGDRLRRLAEAHRVSEDLIVERALDILFSLTDVLNGDAERLVWSELPSDSLRRAEDEDVIDREQAAFEAMHSKLKATHFGKWVAIHNGQVVDSDQDDVALHQRILKSHVDTPVLITRVHEKPMEEFLVRSPRFERTGA
jgi:hypothetical protein